jgi:hypothetical protein
VVHDGFKVQRQMTDDIVVRQPDENRNGSVNRNVYKPVYGGSSVSYVVVNAP